MSNWILLRRLLVHSHRRRSEHLLPWWSWHWSSWSILNIIKVSYSRLSNLLRRTLSMLLRHGTLLFKRRSSSWRTSWRSNWLSLLFMMAHWRRLSNVLLVCNLVRIEALNWSWRLVHTHWNWLSGSLHNRKSWSLNSSVLV